MASQTTFVNAPQRRIEEYFDLNGAGIALNDGTHSSSWYKNFPSKYQKNTVLNFNVNIKEPQGQDAKSYLIFFGGATMWNSYSLVINYTTQTVGLQNCYTPNGASTVTMSSPKFDFPLEYGENYKVSLCLIEIYDKGIKVF